VDLVESFRRSAGRRLFEYVAGPDADDARQRIHATPGPRWFSEGSPIRRVHGDAAMYVGGLTALLMQSLHPLPMAAVVDHSGYKSDPWTRLQNTSTFIAATTFGPVEEAEKAIAAVRAVHDRITGVAPDGRPYDANDPHLLAWIHVAEVDSFLSAYQRYGASPLTDEEADEYVGQAALVGAKVGATDLPHSRAELAEAMAAFRPELEGTPGARDTARFLLGGSAVPLIARPGYTALGAAAVGLLPDWATRMLAIPRLPLADATVGRLSGHAVVTTLRWLTGAQPAPQPAPSHA
jgi:uncharacterized protein (DUF2236 family)